jgi:hypothetical protein
MESRSLEQGTLYFDGVSASQILARAPSTEELSIQGGTYSFSSAQVFDRDDQATLKEKRRLWRDSAAELSLSDKNACRINSTFIAVLPNRTFTRGFR